MGKREQAFKRKWGGLKGGRKNKRSAHKKVEWSWLDGEGMFNGLRHISLSVRHLSAQISGGRNSQRCTYEETHTCRDLQQTSLIVSVPLFSFVVPELKAHRL